MLLRLLRRCAAVAGIAAVLAAPTLVSANTGCTLTSCTSGGAATGSVNVVTSGSTATLTYQVTSPAYADIRGVFFDATGSGLDSAHCSVSLPSNPTLLTATAFNTMRVGSNDANLQGCARHAYDFAADIGTQGMSKDDIYSVAVVLTCDRTLTDADFANAQFGLRITSVGTTATNRGDSAKLSCVAPGSIILPQVCPDYCQQSACPNPPTCGWVPTSSFGTCSAADGSGCGSGTSTRTVACQCNGVTVGDAQCSAFPKPATSQACEDKSKCTCGWVYQPWGTCGTDCKHSRTAQCKCGPYAEADTTKCGAQSALTESCTGGSCACAWSYSPWSSCCAADGSGCGSGTSTRTATCKSSTGALCPDASCGTKDTLTQTCDDKSKCTCGWVYSPWGTCGTDCKHSRTAQCKCGPYAEADTTKCGAQSALSESCSGDSCSCSWSYSAFSTCSATDGSGCGPGTSTRTATCKSTAGTVCPDSACGPKDTCSQACDDKSKCTCSYVYQPWGTCSTTCGTGEQTRSYKCMCGPYESDYTKCGTPDSCLQKCYSSSGCTCSWKYSDWGSCSSTCGTGLQKRTGTCTADGSGVDNVACDRCGTATLTQSCTGTSTCGVGCQATSCSGDMTGAVASVSFAAGATPGTLTGTVTLSSPAYGDLRGVFIDFASGSGINAAKCTLTADKSSSCSLTSFQRDTNTLSDQTNVNLEGCSTNSGTTFDLASAFGSEGTSKDDCNKLVFNLSCKGQTLTTSSVIGATVGVRVTSVGTSATSREDSAKLTCVAAQQAAFGRRL